MKDWLIKIDANGKRLYVGNKGTLECLQEKAHRWHYKKDAQAELDCWAVAGWASRESMTLEKG